MKKFQDNRVGFFWDGKGELTRSYSKVLQLTDNKPAWDIYLVFDRGAEWQMEPPVPEYWMHQLWGVSPERKLDGEKLALELKKLLN